MTQDQCYTEKMRIVCDALRWLDDGGTQNAAIDHMLEGCAKFIIEEAGSGYTESRMALLSRILKAMEWSHMNA